MNRKFTVLTQALFLFFIVSKGNAQSCTATSDGNWSNAAIWTATGGATCPPSDGFSGTITINANVTANTTWTASDAVVLNISNNKSLTFQANNIITLANNASLVNIYSGSSVLGGGSNARITIGVAPTSTSYGPFTSGGALAGPRTLRNNGQSALPVGLASFRALPFGKSVELAWETTWEQGASHFVIERGNATLGEFTSLGTVSAKGTTDQHQRYSFSDGQPGEGVNYYRLRQVDLSGKFEVSKIISAIVRSEQAAVLVTPNPSDSKVLTFKLHGVADLQVRVLTHTGKAISGKLLGQSVSEARWTPDQPLAPGLYLAELKLNGTERQVVKVMIQ